MTPEELIRALRYEFIDMGIAHKAGWGKHEITLAFERAVSAAFAKLTSFGGGEEEKK